ncbi:MAG: isoamylase early set domain-containing protein [Longimicrobiales bacterium]
MSELDPRLEGLVARLKIAPEPNAQALARLQVALRQRADAPPTRGRMLVLSPARAVAWALSIVLATSAVWLWAVRNSPGQGGSLATGTPVQFVFVSEHAQRISLVGDFNDWDPAATRMARGAGGVWWVIVPLRPGRFAYSFLVDDKVWHSDPEATVTTHDFGRPSSIVYVAQAESL